MPFSLSKDFSTDELIAAFPEIKGINSKLASGMQLPVLFIAVKKDRKNHVRDLHRSLVALPEMAGIKMIIYVEHTVDVNDIADTLWRFCNNLDPKRDHFYGDSNIVGLDGTLKTKALDGFERPWPNIIVADKETIKSVDAKWSEMGMGALIPSPSLKYQSQMYGEEAEIPSGM